VVKDQGFRNTVMSEVSMSSTYAIVSRVSDWKYKDQGSKSGFAFCILPRLVALVP
jgi:hypothetical protein